jgi:hypothetical protein
MLRKIPLRHIDSSVVLYALLTIVASTVFHMGFPLTVDLDRCEVLPRGVDDSTPYRENEPCSEECYIVRVQRWVKLSLTVDADTRKSSD